MTHLVEAVWPVAALGLLTFAATGCPSTNPADAAAPDGPSVDRQDTELKHEPCDLGSSSAKGTDANGDGRPDLVKVYEGGREVCRAADINMDTIIDVFSYFDSAGQLRRRESGFDRDTIPDEISYYKSGVLVRKERETNNDQKIDTWDYYQGPRLVRELRDSTGDGYIDQWWTFNRPAHAKCAVVVSDIDGDGEPDADSQIDICKDKYGVDNVAPPAPKPTATDKPEEPPEDAASETPPTDKQPESGKEGEQPADKEGP